MGVHHVPAAELAAGAAQAELEGAEEGVGFGVRVVGFPRRVHHPVLLRRVSGENEVGAVSYGQRRKGVSED